MIENLLKGILRILLAIMIVPLSLVYCRVIYEAWGRVSTASEIVSNTQITIMTFSGLLLMLAWGKIMGYGKR
jgi:hypothetical protein